MSLTDLNRMTLCGIIQLRKCVSSPLARSLALSLARQLIFSTRILVTVATCVQHGIKSTPPFWGKRWEMSDCGFRSRVVTVTADRLIGWSVCRSVARSVGRSVIHARQTTIDQRTKSPKISDATRCCRVTGDQSDYGNSQRLSVTQSGASCSSCCAETE